MPKLHELLAVEGDLEGTFRKILKETAVTFTKKADRFIGALREYKPFDEEEKVPKPDYKEMDETVPAKLDYQADHIIRYLDVVLQKELTNQTATADIEVDGVKIAAGLPATFLLGLETKLRQVRDAYIQIPTLQPGVKWDKAPDRGDHIYEARPEETFKTEKVVEPVVLYEATKEHPAQVKEASKTVNVGIYKKIAWSGMISPAEKSQLLERIDKLIRAVKKARQRANTAKVVESTVGQQLFDYIHSD